MDGAAAAGLIRHRDPLLILVGCGFATLTIARSSVSLFMLDTLPCFVPTMMSGLSSAGTLLTLILRIRNLLRRHMRTRSLLRDASGAARLSHTDSSSLPGPAQQLGAVVPVAAAPPSLAWPAQHSDSESDAPVTGPWYLDARFDALVGVLAFFNVLSFLLVDDFRDRYLNRVVADLCPMVPVRTLTWPCLIVVHVALAAFLGFKIRSFSDELGIRSEIIGTALTASVVELVLFFVRPSFEQWLSPRETALVQELSLLPSTCVLLAGFVGYPLWLLRQRDKATFASMADKSVANFYAVLENDEARAAFKLFLVQSFCPECIMFWEEARKFRAASDALTSHDRLVALATRIYSRYIARDAALIVNLSSEVVRGIEGKLARTERGEAELAPDLFEPARLSVEALMRNDPFVRFQQSKLYESILV